MAKKMMILGASALQVPAIKKAKELGYETIVIDYNPEAVGFELADVKLVISTIDLDAVYEAALEYKPDVVLTSTSDAPVRTAAYVNEKIGLRPDLSYEDSKCATIKSYMRNRLKEKNVPIPKFFVADNYDEYLVAVKELDYKAIVKPADNAGSRGVTLLQSQDEKVIKDTYEYSLGNSRGGQLMVEEYMTGPEVSVESMTVDGETTVITITDKLITPPPFFVELGHKEPSTLSEEVKAEIIRITKQAIAAIGMQNCPSHTEIKVTPEGPKIVEIAARLGGDFITSRLVPLSTGVDIVGESIVLATGQQPKLDKTIDQGAAIVFLPGKVGVLESIDVPEEVPAYIEEICIDMKPGDEIRNTESSNDRLGHIIATGADADKAYENARAFADKIRVTYR